MAESRVSTFALEVLNSGDVSDARVSSFAIQVLMSEATSSSQVIDIGTGTLTYTGQAPGLIIDQIVDIGPDALVYSGQAPNVINSQFVEIPAGELSFDGQAPNVFLGLVVLPGAGALTYSGGQPFVSNDAFVAATQSALILLGEVQPETRASQSAVMMVGEIVPDVKATQSAILVLVDAQPCVSRRADVWIIERRDGERLAFTSHDLPVAFGGLTATPCASLTPTAIEQASEISGVGNMELQGLISSARITEADLFGGLYDDAFVEVWRVSWDPALPEPPVRMAAGWWGNLQHGEEGFSAEVLGPGSRLQQQALVQMVTPGCRRDFGSPQAELPPGGCGVNRESYKVEGEVLAAANRARFTFSFGAPGTAPQYANGLVRWLSGPNAGINCEVKTVDFGAGELVLWSPPPFLPNPGDDFDLLPGCDKLPETCKLYSNFINFGGFPDVPGTDAISETPDAKL
jgi:uncharacterized phage protein (TIGR02218 family)